MLQTQLPWPLASSTLTPSTSPHSKARSKAEASRSLCSKKAQKVVKVIPSTCEQKRKGNPPFPPSKKSEVSRLWPKVVFLMEQTNPMNLSFWKNGAKKHHIMNYDRNSSALWLQVEVPPAEIAKKKSEKPDTSTAKQLWCRLPPLMHLSASWQDSLKHSLLMTLHILNANLVHNRTRPSWVETMATVQS